MEQSDCIDRIEPILQCRVCRRLREEHEEAVKAFVKVRIAFRLQKLDSKDLDLVSSSERDAGRHAYR